MIQNEIEKGDTVTALNPQTGLVAEGLVVRVTKNDWLHVEFPEGTFRMTRAEAAKVSA